MDRLIVSVEGSQIELRLYDTPDPQSNVEHYRTIYLHLDTAKSLLTGLAHAIAFVEHDSFPIHIIEITEIIKKEN